SSSRARLPGSGVDAWVDLSRAHPPRVIRRRAATGSPATTPEAYEHECRRAHPPGLLQRSGGAFLPGVDERDGRGATDHAVPALRLDIQRVARIGERDRDPDVADVLPEARRPDGIRHVSDLRRAGPDGPVLRHLGAELVTLELDAHEPAIDSGASHLLQGGLPDVVLGLVLDEAFEPHDVEGRVAEP